ncbi:hypothetical protein ACOMHN_013275 [Nucella lapillus]
MIHGPCGAINPKNCCMDQTTKKCTKKFSKAFHATIDQGEDSYPKYRRRSEEDGGHVRKLKDSVIITNQWVVPYNPYLLNQFNCHINVEICSSIKSIKYVLKYVHKGTDQAVFQLQKAGTAQQEDHQQNNVDEISMFQNARYIGSIEAGWRLLGNDIHERFPMVQRLSVHLENGQRVYFRQDNAMDRAHGPPPATTRTAFFQLCNEDPSAIKLKYPEVPEQYTWQLTQKQWQKRKRGKAIGRMYTISPRQGECYFLRLLLNVVKGPKSYDDLKTVNGEVCATFRKACQKQGLLEDDQHLQLTMEEACATQNPKLLRDLLAIILVSCNPSQPGHLWVNFRDHLAEDFLISFRREVGDEAAQYTDTIYNQAICAIEDQLLALAGKHTEEFDMPKAEREKTDWEEKTLHSTFKVPLSADKQDRPMCAIKKGTSLARVIGDTAAIIIDEAPMTNKAVFEAMYRTLQDLKQSAKPMGGIPTLFCGDFRHILPVVLHGTRSNIVNASIKKSYLWPDINVKHLTTNMRSLLTGNADAARFADLLLDVGNGDIPLSLFPDTISIPDKLCQFADTLQNLKEQVFPDMHLHCHDPQWLSERAIISPLNETVNMFNKLLMSEFPGDATAFTSIDTATSDEEAVLYPQELLNSIEMSGLPPHELILKVGAPIILLRALQPPKMNNGTRCVVKRLQSNVIEATIACGPFQGEAVLLPRIPLEPTDSPLPFTFRRLQFPIKPAFALTINKSQGQTFSVLGADLRELCFSHGMFYVAVSRTGSCQTLTLLAPKQETRNVVYPEALN